MFILLALCLIPRGKNITSYYSHHIILVLSSYGHDSAVGEGFQSQGFSGERKASTPLTVLSIRIV